MREPRLIPWRGKFRSRIIREGKGWGWNLYLGVLVINVQWRYSWMGYGDEITGVQIGWIPLNILEGGLLKILVNIIWKRDRVQEYWSPTRER